MPRPLESRTRPKVGESQCSFSAILVHPKTCRDNQTIVMNQGIEGTLFSGKHVELVCPEVQAFAQRVQETKKCHRQVQKFGRNLCLKSRGLAGI